MREILFRGKRQDNGEWVEGDLLRSRGKCYIHEHIDPFDYLGELSGFIKMYEVGPETVGQYIGLTDKNGNRIFEGDIIKEKELPRIYMIDYHEDLMKYAFLYYHKELKNIYCGGFVIKKDGKLVEVIGTIYDNPELLQE